MYRVQYKLWYIGWYLSTPHPPPRKENLFKKKRHFANLQSNGWETHRMRTPIQGGFVFGWHPAHLSKFQLSSNPPPPPTTTTTLRIGIVCLSVCLSCGRCIHGYLLEVAQFCNGDSVMIILPNNKFSSRQEIFHPVTYIKKSIHPNNEQLHLCKSSNGFCKTWFSTRKGCCCYLFAPLTVEKKTEKKAKCYK